MKILSHEEICKIAALHYRYYSQFEAMQLTAKKYIPDLFIENESEFCFADASKIQIGLKMMFFEMVKNEKEVDAAIIYLLTHETMHQLCTPDKAWKWGLKEGVRQMCIKMSEIIEGKGKRRFIKDSDIDNFLSDIKKEGYYLTHDSLTKFAHLTQNSLEDGRIERIKAKISKLFKSLMIFYRGAFWNSTEITEKADKSKILFDLLNQILCLATLGTFEKGFVKYYANTKEYDFFDTKIIPLIAKGVYAPKCKLCMGHAIEIEKELVPYILEMAKKEDAFDDMMKNEELTPDRNVGTQDEKEDTDKEDNEIYNDLMSEESEEEEIKENADEEEAAEDETGDGSGEESDITDENGESGKEAENGDNADEGDEVNVKPNEKDGDEVPDESENKGENQNNNGSPSYNKNGQHTEKFEPISKTPLGYLGSRTSVGNNAEKITNPKKVEASIKNAMKEASVSIDTLNDCANNAIKKVKKVKPIEDKWSEWQANKAINEKYNSMSENVTFNEHKRVYDVTHPLPTDIESAAAIAKKEVDKLFNKTKEPCYRGRTSGQLDANNFWMLTGGISSVFTKKAKNTEKKRAIYLLCDNSGSMGNGKFSKRYWATRSLAILEECFKERVPLKITAFDAQGYNYVTHECIKGWEEQYEKNCSFNFYALGRSGYGNKDGYSIRIATDELLARPEEEKLLVILSDGAPTNYKEYGQGEPDVRDAVETARKKGVEVASIFFANDYQNNSEAKAFEKMYQYNCVCTDPENITNELFRIIKTFCFR